MTNKELTRDVFLCHASEDKVLIVRPLAHALHGSQITYWLDEAEIGWGDSLTGKVNEGLRISKFFIIVLSETFLEKQWPQKELNLVLNLEISNGEVRALPLLVGDKKAIDKIILTYPLLNDKRYLTWDGNPKVVVEELKRKLNLTKASPPPQLSGQPKFTVPLPQIKKKYSDQDKSNFLRESFTIVKEYFEDALKQIARHDARFGAEFTEVNNLKFMAVIFVDGELKKRCVIWQGGFSISGGNQISYREGAQFDIQNDGSMNDWISVEVDDTGIFLKSGGFGLRGDRDHMTQEEGAEYLWTRFTEHL